MIDVSPDHIRRLSPDTCQRSQILQTPGHFTTESVQQISGTGNDIFRLIVVESGRLDILFQLF